MTLTLRVKYIQKGKEKDHYVTFMRDSVTFEYLKQFLEADEIDVRDVYFEDTNERYFYDAKQK